MYIVLLFSLERNWIEKLLKQGLHYKYQRLQMMNVIMTLET